MLKYLIIDESFKDLANKLGKGLLIFTIVILAVGIPIGVWRMVVFFNSGNRMLKEQKQRKEVIEKLIEKRLIRLERKGKKN